jgi:hypothetical protein
LKAFLRVFLRKKRRENSAGHGSEAEWNELADEVNRYASMVGDVRDDNDNDNDKADDDDSDGGGGGGDDDNDNENREGEGDDRIDTDMDREQEDADEVAVDQFEDTAEKGELDSVDLALEPITVAERREACVLLSKVRISFSYKVLINKSVGYFAFYKDSKQRKISRRPEAESRRRRRPLSQPRQSHRDALELTRVVPSPTA